MLRYFRRKTMGEDSDTAQYDDQLTTRYKVSDLCITNTGIPNVPDQSARENLLYLAELLQQIYDQVGPFTVLSAYRSPDVNTAVGGDTSSYHTSGKAADITPTSEGLETFFAKLIIMKDNCGELAIKKSQNSIHLSIPTLLKTGVVMNMDAAGNYVRLTDSEIAAYTAMINSSSVPSVEPDSSVSDAQYSADGTTPATKTAGGMIFGVLAVLGILGAIIWKKRA